MRLIWNVQQDFLGDLKFSSRDGLRLFQGCFLILFLRNADIIDMIIL